MSSTVLLIGEYIKGNMIDYTSGGSIIIVIKFGKLLLQDCSSEPSHIR